MPSVIAGGYPTKNMETPKDQNLGRCQNFHQLSPQHIYDAAQVAGPELGAWRRLATPCTMASPGSSTTEFWDKNGLFLKMSVSLRPGTPQPPCRKSLPIHKSKKKGRQRFHWHVGTRQDCDPAVGGWLWSLKLQQSPRLWSDSRHVSILVNQQRVRVQVHPAIHPSGYD